MRYINLNDVLQAIPAAAVTVLSSRHQIISNGDHQIKISTIDSGNAAWSQVKETLEGVTNRKCWYTESKNPGCVNDVDHFRPKGRVKDANGNVEYWYWFLAFDPENYRLSCQFSNRPNANNLLGATGGKHHYFPLLNNQPHATNKLGIANENPILLDPCNQSDCELLQFQADGRPVIAQAYQSDTTACLRVAKSNLLLNLDYPTFNEDREQIYNKVKTLVERGDSYGPIQARLDIQSDLRQLMHKDSAYSKAAECYIRCFRNREWVEELFI